MRLNNDKSHPLMSRNKAITNIDNNGVKSEHIYKLL